MATVVGPVDSYNFGAYSVFGPCSVCSRYHQAALYAPSRFDPPCSTQGDIIVLLTVHTDMLDTPLAAKSAILGGFAAGWNP